VLVQANTSIFEASGQLQLYVTAMKPTGLGDLYLKYEELKRRLHEEGLFDPARKKPLPQYPMRIGLKRRRPFPSGAKNDNLLSLAW
jgi:exodeoxyribonuclease VII large subunit